jgi:hypothetical protein
MEHNFMQMYEKAIEAAEAILTIFKNPNELPKPIAAIFIHRKDPVPCRNWSWRNRLLVALHGYSDARGFRQWLVVHRQVKKGEKAFYILSPCARKKVDEVTSEEKTVVYGFRGTPVFGLEQTEGEALPEQVSRSDEWVDNLPLIEAARSWGIDVETFNGGRGAQGRFARLKDGSEQSIAIGVKNLATWAHELVHAADYRNGKLTELGQHWRSETVAELGGAVLLRILGFEQEADLGGCWEYIQYYATKSGIEVVDACGRVLDRTCEAVALILDEAEKSRGPLVSDLALAAG